MTVQIPDVAVPQTIAALLPVLASLLSGWLQQDRLPKYVNALIAVVFFLVASAACLALSGKITGNLQVDSMIEVGYVLLLIRSYSLLFKDVMDAIPSPFLLFVRKEVPAIAPILDEATAPRLVAVPKVTNAVQPVPSPTYPYPYASTPPDNNAG